MDNFSFWIMLLKILVFLPFIILLIYLSMKYGTRKLQNMQNGKFIKVLERVAISKDNSLVVVKIGDKGYVLTSSASNMDKLLEIEPEDLIKIESTKSINEFKNMKEFYEKVFKKKEDKL